MIFPKRGQGGFAISDRGKIMRLGKEKMYGTRRTRGIYRSTRNKGGTKEDKLFIQNYID